MDIHLMDINCYLLKVEKKTMEAYNKLVLKSLVDCTDFSTLLTFICRLTSNVKRSENMPTYAQLMLVL